MSAAAGVFAAQTPIALEERSRFRAAAGPCLNMELDADVVGGLAHDGRVNDDWANPGP